MVSIKYKVEPILTKKNDVWQLGSFSLCCKCEELRAISTSITGHNSSENRQKKMKISLHGLITIRNNQTWRLQS